MWITELAALATAFVFAVVGTRAIELVARRKNLHAKTTERGAHVRPTPRLGGAAIAAATLGGLALAVSTWSASLGVFIAGGVILLALGTIDDLRTLPVLPRSLVQVSVAGVTAFALSVELTIALPNVSIDLAGWPAFLIVTLLITAMINVFNFMDGIDGIVAGTAAATMPAAMIMGGGIADALAIGIAGACLGFLVWNHHPASIFMGDGGSYFLGYAVAMAFLIDPGPSLQTIPMLLALAPFFVDTSATLARRVANRENVFSAHRGHLFQRLVRSGASQRLTTAAYVLTALGAGIIAINYGDAPALVQTGVIGACVAAWMFVAARVPDPDRRART